MLLVNNLKFLSIFSKSLMVRLGQKNRREVKFKLRDEYFEVICKFNPGEFISDLSFWAVPLRKYKYFVFFIGINENNVFIML